jgi:tetratricopeptide (TPR) repeat protein
LSDYLFLDTTVLWYERNGDKIIPRLDLFTGFRYDVDGSSAGLLSEYELLLKDYQESLFNDASGDMDDMPEMCEMAGQAEDYGRDNVYEADLHRNIGVLYLMIGSTHSIVPGGDNDIRSASHFKEAMRLYELTGESFAEGMGITKYTYSIYHLRNGNYRLSEKLYAEALDIFHSVAKANGEDNSPFTMGGLQQQQQQQQQNLQLHHSLQSSQRKQNVVKLTQATDDADSVSSTTASRHPKETKPATIQAVTTTGQPGQQKSSTILVDVQQFLKQNDSIKEEL